MKESTMNLICRSHVFVAILALLTAAPAFTQTPFDEATHEAKAAAPAAYVYVQTHQGVNVFDATAAGKLSLVKGSPFATTGQMAASNGSHLFSEGTGDVHIYTIDSNGAVGKQASEIDTQSYGGAECGNTTGVGATLDHTGKYLYVQLLGAQYQEGNTTCAAWQSYKVASNGELTFLGDMEYNSNADGSAYPSTVPTISGNNKFGYGVFGEEYGSNDFSTFTRDSDGVLGMIQNFTETDPKGNPDGRWIYYPVEAPVVAADPANHLAVLMFAWSNPPSGPESTPFQLASYSINSKGGIESTNKWTDMPTPDVAAYITNMSPSGKLLAVAGAAYGGPGFQIFHFNGADPITAYSKLLLPSVEIDQLGWDNNNHLYALNYSSGELYVYTVTPTSISEASGCPYKVENAYGLNGLIVVPKL
jgi:hypothetical protein